MEFINSVGHAFAYVAHLAGEGHALMIAFSVYMTMILIERFCYLFTSDVKWNEREAIANALSLVFVGIFESLISGGLFVGAYVLIYEGFRLFTIPATYWGWVLAFLLNDLAYYTDHRISHRTGLFWALHSTHHSSQEMNFLVASRGSFLELGRLSSFIYFVLPLIGLHPAMFLAARFFGNMYGIFNHTRLIRRLGPLENILCTPANHRVHHGTEPKYLDRNYGQTLIIWDRMFGTFQREEEEPTFGLVKQMDSHKVWDIQTWGMRILIAQMRSAPRLSDKLRYLIKPPGWSHDGNHMTSETIIENDSIHAHNQILGQV
jgi:sterol desaturase/sphingolipid hydroxylase (fatty acid hydroxylase superfamily)